MTTFTSFAVKTLLEPNSKVAPSSSPTTQIPNPDRPISRIGSPEVGSSAGVDGFDKQSVVSPRSVVFFDADEEFFSDGSVSNKSWSRISNLESELCSTRLALLEETERRKTAEEVVNQMCSQWQRIGRKLSESGLTFPTSSPASDSLGFEAESESVEQLIQELVVTRAGRDQARAEAELVAAALMDSKNLEISRLRDRLQYYETANRAMSHRKVSETARRQREVNNRRRWIWGCIGVTAAVGASAIAYSYFPRESAGTSADTTATNASTTCPGTSADTTATNASTTCPPSA